MVGRIGRMFDRNLWRTGLGWLATLVGVLALAGAAAAAGAPTPVAARLAAATDAFAPVAAISVPMRFRLMES